MYTLGDTGQSLSSLSAGCHGANVCGSLRCYWGTTLCVLSVVIGLPQNHQPSFVVRQDVIKIKLLLSGQMQCLNNWQLNVIIIIIEVH